MKSWLALILTGCLGAGAMLPRAAQAAEFGPHTVTLSYTPILQRTLREGGTNANGELDLIGTLQLSPGGAGARGETRLAFWALGNHTIGGTRSTSAFSRQAGLLWDTNDGESPDPDWSLGVFALQQDVSTQLGTLTFDLGKLYAGNNLAELPYTGDDRDTFLSQIIASDAAGRWYDRIGLGIGLGIEGEGWFAKSVISDASATDRGFDFSTLSDGSNLVAVEAGLTPQIAGRDSRVSLMPYLISGSTDFSRERGLVLVFSHDLSPSPEAGGADRVLFGRYTYRTGGEPLSQGARDDARPLKHGGLLGMAFNRPFGQEDQQVGIAAMYGAASDTARADGLGSQSGIEAYWKTSLGRHAEITGDLQVINRDSSGLEYIPGIRVKLKF
ncbi:MAG: hypothetical protein OIF47_00025 [Marinibacterium sp.]|nr:hypothetical protein [Marinibacterium sp.]